MQANGLLRPIFRNIEVELPNSIVQVRLHRLVKLQRGGEGVVVELNQFMGYLDVEICYLIFHQSVTVNPCHLIRMGFLTPSASN